MKKAYLFSLMDGMIIDSADSVEKLKMDHGFYDLSEHEQQYHEAQFAELTLDGLIERLESGYRDFRSE